MVAAVAERDGRFLLCRRPAHKRHGGLWEFPGGKLEPGESPQDAARRELAEELGVEVLACGEALYAIEDPGSPFVIEFHRVAFAGEPVCLEHAALAWVDVLEMLRLELAPGDRRFAEVLRGEGL
ncbi:(deoxy)nucleoside triphosphate pyrophosphohydrolase [Mesoterricola silvestris]|uniref:8-oxo-dGTP diphosphatase n=1 Tax=Mesoterricola silvestris TaxID=2927979 RepID=A0AA48GXL2_9BACT|nr:(deoxy)nucleoside triphosphate pyrophosphohydrolase [Mesoterricola silvestris]BDU73741.1 pyrimidine (deoxy)nucleoside triphosphate pyrophosphohydrolase [Mesoterricola silvestris]